MLFAAVRVGDLDGMQQALSQGADPNYADAESCNATALMEACVHGHSPAVEALLERGAATELTANGGFTAAHRACAWGQEDALLLLIEFGASLDVPDHAGRTPLQELCKLGGPNAYVPGSVGSSWGGKRQRRRRKRRGRGPANRRRRRACLVLRWKTLLTRCVRGCLRGSLKIMTRLIACSRAVA